jgi:hypothetical protein
MKLSLFRAAAIAGAIALIPAAASACACGCGVFDVGADSLLPDMSSMGLSVWGRVAYMDQNQNWEGDHKAPAADNQDKGLNNVFYFVGGQYMINKDWMVMAQVPVVDRALTTTDDGTVFGPSGSIYTGHDFALGDLDLMATYTGLSSDMSTGIGFGVKLPTGDWHGPNGPLGGAELDRDTLPGTGTTDLIVQAYHAGAVTRDGKLSYFVQAKYQFALNSADQYRPGNEMDAAAGVTYNLGSFGPLTKVAPVLTLLDSYRLHDTGVQSDPLNTGYERVLIDPGVSVRINKVRLDADIAIPIYQHFNAAPTPALVGTAGQLAAGTLMKAQVTYDF